MVKQREKTRLDIDIYRDFYRKLSKKRFKIDFFFYINNMKNVIFLYLKTESLSTYILLNELLRN